jgi:ribosomal protein S18 acetylase RimI-like enzyme
MTVREATADDVDAIREVARAAWAADYPEILTRETVERGVEEWYESDHIAGKLAGSRTRLFVACVDSVDFVDDSGDDDDGGDDDDDGGDTGDDGDESGSEGDEAVDGEDARVVGFAHAELGRDDEGYVLRLYVHPDYRNRGLGRRLLERTRDDLFAHGAERINAMVLAANEPGNEFYRRFGFEKVAEGETTIGGEAYPEHTYALERDGVGS